MTAELSPKPYESWIIDKDSSRWKAPVEHPNDGKFYIWNENDQVWEESLAE
jgi:hypothetical protein